jgi:hypothetical protein
MKAQSLTTGWLKRAVIVVVAVTVITAAATGDSKAWVIEVGGTLWQVSPTPPFVLTPLSTDPWRFPLEEQADMVDVYQTAKGLAANNNVFGIFQGMSCGLAADNAIDVFKTELPASWSVQRVDSYDLMGNLGSTSHTLLLLTSPSGKHYIMDIYTGHVDIAAAFEPFPGMYQIYPDQLRNLTIWSYLALFGNPLGIFKPGAGSAPVSCQCAAPIQKKQSFPVQGGGAHDPNEKIGPAGSGEAHYLAGEEMLPFTIRFENVATATLPAQQVVITDVLDPGLDLSSVELGAIGFNDAVLDVPSGLQHFEGSAQVATDPNPVHVLVELSTEERTLTWVMQSVDSTTNGLPADPLAGFLPPDNEQGQGEGFVTFRARPIAGLSSGSVIQNQATIVFDINPAIVTNVTVNTIDAQAPTSSVQPLSATSPPTFTVSWLGNDGNGSGIAFYDVYASVDGGDFSLWQAGASETQAIFAGEVGHTYGFYSVATDQVGWRQATPAGAQASTTIPTEALGIPALLSPANNTVTTTQALTFSWAAGTGATPDGYNLGVDGAVITTTAQSWATVLPLGIHTWTVRAYNGDGYSAWVSPAWTVEIVNSRHYIYLPLVVRSQP